MRASTWLFPLCACLCAWQGVTCASQPFQVYWNVPSYACAKFGVHINVSQFGIVQNTRDAFYGDKVTIFYDPGAFPFINDEGQEVWGGVPQNGSLATHVQRFINKINSQMPLDFKGAAILDFERYYPSYAASPFKYKKASRAWVKENHPNWSPEMVEAHAQESFNASAKDFFQSLLWIGRELRPGGLWGYYHYPYCHDYRPGEAACTTGMKEMNKELTWLFKSSAAIYPSLYLKHDSGFSPRTRRHFARLRVLEALTVRRRDNPTALVLPYLWCRYRDTRTLVSPLDMVSTLGMSRVAGAEGAVVWGSLTDVATEKQCRNFKTYAEGKFGPLVRYLAHLPHTKLRRLLATRARLKRGVRTVLREVKKRAIDGAAVLSDDLCSNKVLGKCDTG